MPWATAMDAVLSQAQPFQHLRYQLCTPEPVIITLREGKGPPTSIARWRNPNHHLGTVIIQPT
jgi:hypothetical protein